MPEFSVQLSPANTSFSPVRATNPQGNGELVGKALSSIIKGVEVFGKSSARSAGLASAQEQTGIDLPEEQVNREVGEINSLIERELGSELDTVEGPITPQRVNELKDKSLRSLKLTDRHIQSLIDAGTISSTEGNARRRIALSQRMNEGSNFLFRDEFINAMASVTGGVAGSASAATFGQTPEEARQAAIQAAQVKAQADFEEKVTGVQSLFPTRSRDSIVRELQQQDIDAKKFKELEAIKAERELNSDEVAQRLDLSQSATARSLEVTIGQLSQPNGTLDQNNLLAVKTSVRQAAQAMMDSLADIPNINATYRAKAEADIKLWVEGMEARLKLTDASDFNKEQLEDLQTASQIFGVKSNPYAAILLKTNPELLKELNIVPMASRSTWLKNRLGEEGARDLEAAAAYLKDNANFYKDGVNVIEDYRNVVDSLNTEQGLTALVKDELLPKFKRMFMEAPVETAEMIGGQRFVVAAQTLNDKALQSKTKVFFDMYRRNLSHTIDQLGSDGITIRYVDDYHVRNYAGERKRAVVDLPDDLASVEGTKEGIIASYKAFTKHKWAWAKDFETPDQAFNAYLRGEYEIAEPLQEEAPKKEVTQQGTEKLTPIGSKTPEGRPIYKNQDGDFVTERTITENIPELGGWVNLPTVYDGKFVSPDEAIKIVIDSKGIDPVTNRKLEVFRSIEEAVSSAENRSKSLDQYMPKEPLSVQNNNPGNLRSFGDVPQVDTPSGKFAKFDSPELGMRALARDISTKLSRGDNSISEIISKYSPASDPENIKRGLTPESYIKFVVDKTGIPADKVLTENDVPALMEAIVNFESGSAHPFTREQILKGIEDAKENR